VNIKLFEARRSRGATFCGSHRCILEWHITPPRKVGRKASGWREDAARNSLRDLGS